MKTVCLLGLAAIWSAGLAQAQDADRVTVPFTDPARPKMLRVSLLSGSITVKGYEGKEAIVEAKGRISQRRSTPKKAEGMRRIDAVTSGLSVEEDDNTVKVGTSAMSRPVDVQITVPFDTSVYLRSVNSGQITVERISGEIDVNNVNGAVTLTNVSGAVVAHALNADVVVTMDKVTAGKPMSFSSLNGDIDVTLPQDVKANVKMKSDNGDMFTDFEITTTPAPSPTTSEGSTKGRYKIKIDRAIHGKINGGGPEYQFTTLNGRIYIRKKK